MYCVVICVRVNQFSRHHRSRDREGKEKNRQREKERDRQRERERERERKRTEDKVIEIMCKEECIYVKTAVIILQETGSEIN